MFSPTISMSNKQRTEQDTLRNKSSHQFNCCDLRNQHPTGQNRNDGQNYNKKTQVVITRLKILNNLKRRWISCWSCSILFVNLFDFAISERSCSILARFTSQHFAALVVLQMKALPHWFHMFSRL